MVKITFDSLTVLLQKNLSTHVFTLLYLQRYIKARPITVLVTFSNIMGRILSQQLDKFFEEKLSPYLFAYRRNYSCQTALAAAYSGGIENCL